METHCLYCDEQLQFRFSWQTLWHKNDQLLCQECSSQLEPIEGEICLCCGRLFEQQSEPFRSGDYCYDCIRWEKDSQWQGLLVKNRSLFRYNDFMKELIARYKYRGDALLARLFQERLIQLYKKEYSQTALIVPIPLSQERLLERGFNQAQLLAEMLGKTVPVLQAQHKMDKQSKKSRSERLDISSSSFFLASGLQEKLSHTDIIIIDDIYTTGITVRQAAKLFKQHGVLSVSSITIAR